MRRLALGISVVGAVIVGLVLLRPVLLSSGDRGRRLLPHVRGGRPGPHHRDGYRRAARGMALPRWHRAGERADRRRAQSLWPGDGRDGCRHGPARPSGPGRLQDRVRRAESLRGVRTASRDPVATCDSGSLVRMESGTRAVAMVAGGLAFAAGAQPQHTGLNGWLSYPVSTWTAAFSIFGVVALTLWLARLAAARGLGRRRARRPALGRDRGCQQLPVRADLPGVAADLAGARPAAGVRPRAPGGRPTGQVVAGLGLRRGVRRRPGCQPDAVERRVRRWRLLQRRQPRARADDVPVLRDQCGLEHPGHRSGGGPCPAERRVDPHRRPLDTDPLVGPDGSRPGGDARTRMAWRWPSPDRVRRTAGDAGTSCAVPDGCRPSDRWAGSAPRRSCRCPSGVSRG